VNQILIGPDGQLLGPQGQPLGYTAVQTPQGLIAIPNQLPQLSPLGQQQPQPSPPPTQGSSSSWTKLALAAALLAGGYWFWKRYVSPKTKDGRKTALRERRARRSRSRLMAEVKRYLEDHPEANDAEEAEEDAYEASEACEACETGECADHQD
jgi:hypothetical protein